ncbi:MAG: PrsW family intramembrane metalloprotease [Chloroflexi bacterium]|nr:PrsW family intramembrane metalloprotease [Chloroflexota bacterium]MCI0576496.1 PrsW family intramembrane metalloprotease [Chloroflexota bacterium]MCI0650218.1 PrsW family intramembrane metalloprotease [Chloroflexota bacterium]MCI0729396.1 PrsW family intramembrane metalloprotease [Chloroflexota bacterium]
MEIFILSVIAAILPALFFISIIYWVDRYEKEPAWLLSAAFLWGAIPSIILAFVVNTISSLVPYFVFGPGIGEAIAASFIAPPVEESIKGLALVGIFFLWRQELDSPLDGIIYGAMVGMGFAVIENVYYFLNVYAEGGPEAWGVNIFIRAFIFGLNHSLFTSMTGLGIALARLSHRTVARVTAPIVGWSAAVFLHFVHNFTASVAAAVGPIVCLATLFNAWGGVFLILLIIIWALWQEQLWIRRYLADEVQRGTLTADQYANACSGFKRAGHSTRVLFNRGPVAYYRSVHFYYRCSELAYKKHHFATLKDAKSDQLTEKLRGEIARLGTSLT